MTCGAAFNSQQYLNRHISRHFAEKKHKCRDCDMAFIDKRDYIVHVSKVHANHRPFACSSCGMAYKTKQGMHFQLNLRHFSRKMCQITFLTFWQPF